MKKISMGRVLFLLLTLIISRNSFGQHHVQGNWGNTYLYFDDDSSSVPPKTIAVYRNENGPLYTLRMEGDKVLDLTVDGHAVSSDSINGSYKAVIQEIKVQVERARVQARLDRQQAERDREQAGRDREQAERDREQAERDRGQSEKERQQAGRDQEQAERDRQQAGRDREQAEHDREQAERDRKRAAEDRAIMQSIMDDLVKDGLVPDKESIHSLKINADEFLLNGKSLPEAVQKKYIGKYVTGKGYSMSYHNED
jgi:chromosome segregation ATPase